jgi:hypothetical protein
MKVEMIDIWCGHVVAIDISSERVDKRELFNHEPLPSCLAGRKALQQSATLATSAGCV